MTNHAQKAQSRKGQGSARKGNSDRPAPTLRGRGRPKGSTDPKVAADRAEFLAAVEKAAAKGPAWIDEAVEAVQQSREARGKDRYTGSSLRQTLVGWGRDAGIAIQQQDEGWVAAKR